MAAQQVVAPATALADAHTALPSNQASTQVPSEVPNEATVPAVPQRPALQTIDQAHPYLFFDASDVALLRMRMVSTHKDIWQAIRLYVDGELGVQPPMAPPAGAVEDTFRQYGNRLIPFSFVCLLTDEERYCQLAKEYALAYAGWTQWDVENRCDLGLAHMVMGNAIAYDWLYHYFSDTERDAIRSSLAHWTQRLYEASSKEYYDPACQNWWRKSYMQNHHWINHSALGMAGLALLPEDSRAAIWVDQAAKQLANVQYLLDNIADGSWHEGVPYQSYGLTMLLPFLANLDRLLGQDLHPHKYLANYPLWGIYNALPDRVENILTYGNREPFWGNSYMPQNIYRYIAANEGNGHAEWMAQHLISVDGRHRSIWSAPWYVFEFLYYDPTIQPVAPDGLNMMRVYPDLEGVILRTGWDKNDLVFGLKTGAYGGRFAYETFTQGLYPWTSNCAMAGCQLNIGHDHDDSNTFYLYRAGAWLAPETYGDGLLDTAYHNTLLIDGQGQYRPQSDSYDQGAYTDTDGYLQSAANVTNYAYVAANATKRYKQIAGIEDVTRHVVFVRPDYFLMLDNVAAASPHKYEWISHFGESVSVENDWIRGGAEAGQILGVNVVAPRPFTVRTGNDGLPFAAIGSSEPVQSLRFLNLLVPTDTVSWANRPSAQLVADTGSGILAAVTNTYKGQVDDILINYTPSARDGEAPPIAAIEVGNYRTDGRALVVSKAMDGETLRLFMHGGTSVTDIATGVEFIRDMRGARDVEIEYSDTEVAVIAQGLTSITLWLPPERTLKVNGVIYPVVRQGEYVTVRVLPYYLPMMLRSYDNPVR